MFYEMPFSEVYACSVLSRLGFLAIARYIGKWKATKIWQCSLVEVTLDGVTALFCVRPQCAEKIPKLPAAQAPRNGGAGATITTHILESPYGCPVGRAVLDSGAYLDSSDYIAQTSMVLYRLRFCAWIKGPYKL